MGRKNGAILLSIFMAALLFIPNRTVAAEKAVNAKTVAERMDKGKYTSAEIKTYLKGLKGSTISADGKVHDVLTGKTGNRVVVYVNTPKSKDFIVDVYVDNASKLHKGNAVFCKGVYHKYNSFTVNGITLKDGSCSKR